jgi:predicted ABC-type ATPase
VRAKRGLPQPSIYVIAGPNGGGKSSIIGAMLLHSGADFLNPDAESKRIRDENPALSVTDANSMAWKLGRSMLERAIREKKTFALETTLGGTTITSLLETAADSGVELRVWFVSLATPELHIKRVRSRVSKGGHDIPEVKIRERFDKGRANLIRLLPKVTELRLYDNSFEADPTTGREPAPKLILHYRERVIVATCDPAETPDWAKPILEVALKIHDLGRMSHS